MCVLADPALQVTPRRADLAYPSEGRRNTAGRYSRARRGIIPRTLQESQHCGGETLVPQRLGSWRLRAEDVRCSGGAGVWV